MVWLQRLRVALGRFGPVAGRVLCPAGGVLLLVAAGFGLHSWLGVRSLMQGTATVSENVSSFAPGGGVIYTPRLRFRAAGGELVQVLTSRGGEDIEFPAGTSLPVRYPAGKPREAFIATVSRVYPAALTFGILGVAVLDLGLIFWFVSRRENTRKPA